MRFQTYQDGTYEMPVERDSLNAEKAAEEHAAELHRRDMIRAIFRIGATYRVRVTHDNGTEIFDVHVDSSWTYTAVSAKVKRS